MLRELIDRVKSEDPVRGEFQVPPTTHGKVWCDASSLGIGVAVQIGEVVVEDAAWLRKRDDVAHINRAELEAVVCLLYTSPSPRDKRQSRMPSSA